MKVIEALALSYVPRWGIVDHIGGQSVADHTFRTLVIYVHLCDFFKHEITISDVMTVLYHDIEESRTGDIPSPAKDRLGIAPSEPDIRGAGVLARLADLIEAHTFIARYGLGSHSSRVAMSLYKQIKEECPEGYWPFVSELIDQITFDHGR
jgi:hypothetical protein